MMKSFLGMKWKWYGIIDIYKNNLNRLVRNKEKRYRVCDLGESFPDKASEFS
jgi:hypothetical protein